MSHGGGYQGGRTRMGTKVILNIYDLSPLNDTLITLGLGLHHSGVEILGSEYSFASGGGIFESTPKDAPGAKFRGSIDMGTFEGGAADLRMVIADLRDDFGPNSYNLVLRNCNHFANALCWALLGRPIPGYVNRVADIGRCCSCFLPRKMLESAPVGPNDGSAGGSSSGGFQVSNGWRRDNNSSRGATTSSKNVFSGSGSKLGSSAEEQSGGQGTGMLSGLLSAGTGRRSNARTSDDDLTDRREKARKAALARLERSGNNDNEANSGLKSS